MDGVLGDWSPCWWLHEIRSRVVTLIDVTKLISNVFAVFPSFSFNNTLTCGVFVPTVLCKRVCGRIIVKIVFFFSNCGF